MSRKAVSRFLVLYLLAVWGAVVARCDRYPLTWAPMYSRFSASDVTSSREVDHEQFNRGMFVTRRDGSTDQVGRKALNISRQHMYRLYYQRTFGKPAAKHANANQDLSTFNRWLRGLDPGEDAIPNDTAFQVLRSLNRTLGHEPDDPGFIVRVQADVVRVFRRLDDLSVYWREKHEADIHWSEEWRERW